MLNKTSREGLRQVYDGRSSIQIYEKTLSQRKNDKWERCDTKTQNTQIYLAKQNLLRIVWYSVPPAHAPASVLRNLILKASPHARIRRQIGINEIDERSRRLSSYRMHHYHQTYLTM